MASMDANGQIEFLKPEDAKRVAEIHRDSIKTGFLSSLGVPFLTELYKNMARSPNAFVLVYRTPEGNIEGFVSASTNVKGFYRDFVLKNFLKVTILLLPRVFNLKTLKKILETLMYPVSEGDLPEAELLSIAVTEKMRGKGAAKRLFNAFVEEMRRRGIKTFKVTVSENNLRANRFYEKVGFVFHTYIEVHRGERSKVWIYNT